MGISAKWKVIGLGAGIIIGFIIISAFVLPYLGFKVEFLSSLYGYILILLTAMLIAVSGFLPYKWGKVLKEIALLCLFILLLLVEMSVIKEYVDAKEIKTEECKNFFQPSTSGQIVYDALKYTSCVLTGYFPAEEGDIGWTSFYLFYIVLPFAFIWVLVYTLMKSVMTGWFESVGFNVSGLLSFIIAMYAARTLIGAFLLQFAGYGAWGLGAMFLAMFLTRSVGKLMDEWYGVEKMAEETKNVIVTELEREKAFAESVLPIIDRAKRLGKDENTLELAKTTLATIRNIPLWKTLSPDAQTNADWLIQKAESATNPRDFLSEVDNLEKYLKVWTKK